MMLPRNVGGIDRALRITFGAILFFGGLLLLSGKVRVGVTMVVVGSLALLTGIVRLCALYIPFGISTARPSGAARLKQGCNCAMFRKELLDESDGASPAGRKDRHAQAMTTHQ